MAAGATFTAMERLQRMTQNNGQPHLEPLADVGTATIAVGALLCGFLIGASGRLFVVSIIVALVAGPTSGGLVLLGAILAGAIATLVVIIGLATGHRPYLGVAVVAACAALIVGIFVGSSYGSPRGLGGWAVARVTPTPKIPMPSFPTYLEAHADVTVRLDAASGFTSNPTTGGPDGTFGHWCRSGPDSTLVSDVDRHGRRPEGDVDDLRSSPAHERVPHRPRNHGLVPSRRAPARWPVRDDRLPLERTGPGRRPPRDERDGRVRCPPRRSRAVRPSSYPLRSALLDLPRLVDPLRLDASPRARGGCAGWVFARLATSKRSSTSARSTSTRSFA